MRRPEREARLLDAGLYRGRIDAVVGDRAREEVLVRFLHGSRPPTFAGSESAWSAPGGVDGVLLSFQFPVPDFTLREQAWSAALADPDYPPVDGVSATDLANRYVGWIVKQQTSPFDEMHRRMSSENVDEFKKLMNVHAATFKNESRLSG